MNVKSLTSLVKAQLKDMPEWNIHSYSLTGKDATDYTYTYNQLLYVMKPDDESVAKAIGLIDSILKGEKLENSYTDLGGTTNKVTQAPKPKPSQIEQNHVAKEQPKEDEDLNKDIENNNVTEEMDPELPDQPDNVEDITGNESDQNENENPIDKIPDNSIPITPDDSEPIESIIPQE